ncbi:protein tyrosine kinase [Nocardia sp. NPDC052566]|uniref:protein tyrosine kinase n=1 Tax=Nocardia sp. NPDC052566 TaxID=3364330 RepID=UPI0037C675EC
MTLTDYGRIALRRWPIVLAGLLLGLVVAAGYARTVPVTYTASSTMYVSMATGTSVNDSYQGGLAAQQRVRSYLELVGSANVAQRVHDELGLTDSVDQVRARVSAASPPASTLIVISARDGTADGARRLADAVVAQFRRLVGELETIERDTAPAARVAVVDKAREPVAPGGAKPSRLVALGAVAGLALGYLAAFVRDRLDGRVRTADRLADVLPIAVLARIGGGGDDAAQVRLLRTRLSGNNSTGGPLLLISLTAGTGAEVPLGLARSFAAAGDSVVLVDADAGGRGISVLLPDDSTAGLADALRADTPAADVVIPWPEGDFSVLPIGAVDAATPELLASARFTAVLAELRQKFDDVIVCTGAAEEARALASRCGPAIAVVDIERARISGVAAALAAFGSPAPLGAVALLRRGTRLRRTVERIRERTRQAGRSRT